MLKRPCTFPRFYTLLTDMAIGSGQATPRHIG